MVLKLGTARVALLLLIGSLVVAPACSTAGGTTRGGWDLPGRRSSQLVGEIRSIDARRGRLQVDLAYGGTRTVYFDRRTKVVGQGRRSVSSLRRGDDVRIRVAYDRRGTAWADRIEVYRNGWARNDRGRWDDRRVVTARRVQWQGTVRSIERRRNYFVLDRGRSNVVVRIPSTLSRDEARRLDRLRRGDRVRVEVAQLDAGTGVLVRFR